MTEVNSQNFGILIAYLLPGLVTLVGIAPYCETVRSWLGTPSTAAPTVGGFLYVTLAAVALGMTVSVIRWLILDWAHHHTGIQPPTWDFAVLQTNLGGFLALVENHYRYYQFYGNMFVALGIVAIGYRWQPVLSADKARLLMPTILMLMALFYVASRDALAKYYNRASALLRAAQTPRGGNVMTNGFGMKHEETEKKTPSPRLVKASTHNSRKDKPPMATESGKR
jgi:hypothetical protein